MKPITFFCFLPFSGSNVVYFLLQVSIVLSSTNHMTPGHSLLIRVALDPSVPPSAETHIRTHIQHPLSHAQWVTCYPDWVHRKPPVYIWADRRGHISRCWHGLHEPLGDPEPSSMRVVDPMFTPCKWWTTAPQYHTKRSVVVANIITVQWHLV